MIVSFILYITKVDTRQIYIKESRTINWLLLFCFWTKLVFLLLPTKLTDLTFVLYLYRLLQWKAIFILGLRLPPAVTWETTPAAYIEPPPHVSHQPTTTIMDGYHSIGFFFFVWMAHWLASRVPCAYFPNADLRPPNGCTCTCCIKLPSYGKIWSLMSCPVLSRPVSHKTSAWDPWQWLNVPISNARRLGLHISSHTEEPTVEKDVSDWTLL